MGYEIQCLNIIDNEQYGLRANCSVYVIHVKINDTEQRIKNIIDTINDTSWYKTVADEDINEAFISTRDRTVKNSWKIFLTTLLCQFLWKQESI